MLKLASLCAHSVRCYSTASTTSFPAPPPVSEWRKLWNFKLARNPRVALFNPKTAKRLAEAFFPPEREIPGGKGKVVIELNAGPGVLTRSLLQLPASKIRKLIVLENDPKFCEHVKALEAFDSRVIAVQMSPHMWDSYEAIEKQGLLDDVEQQDWQNESELELVCTMPHSVSGEQLMAQFLRAIPERTWLFKHGRMRMNLLIPEQLYDRIDAPLGKRKRCKLSVITEATSRFWRPVPPLELRPYSENFWPLMYIPRTQMPESRKPGNPMVAVTFDPLKEQVIQQGMLDKWDYCLRRLFVLKSYELQKALPSLAPGADNMMRYLLDPDIVGGEFDVQRRINMMTVKDWESVVNAFDKWPFAPDVLFVQNSFSNVYE